MKNKKFRHEIKFYINKIQYEILRARVKTFLKKDKFMISSNGYQIRSLYFDDIYNTALKEKKRGIEKRKKYRIRIYNLKNDVIKLERKDKNGDLISKTVVNIDKNIYEKIISGDYNFNDNLMPVEFYYHFKTKKLRPVVIVDYLREAYIYPHNNVRITFDKDLRTSLNSLEIFEENIVTTKATDEDLIILEVKYDNFLPKFIKELLGLEKLNKYAISKYMICRQKRRELTYRM